ncbi:MAG: glycosyltransferase, partial [Flavobacteriales bacterium]|nr:glycosyltransferase [Flavobacteriales bacterium]
MHILVLPSFYPDSDNENLGIFFKEQVYALADNSNKVGVVYVEMRSLKNFSWKQLRNSFFQFECNTDNLFIEYRIKGWRIPSFIGCQIWLYLTRKLIDKYILLNGKPDVIHAHNSFYAGMAANDVFVKKHIKYVITEHDSDFLEGNFTKKQKSLISKLYSDSLKVISVSKALKRAMNSVSPHINILVIPNIVNTDYFIPKDKGAAPSALTFLSIGNLTENKNHKLI